MKIDRRHLLRYAGSMVLRAGLPAIGQALGDISGLDYPFKLGVASGDPSADGFVIWTRLAPEPLQYGGGMPASPVAVIWEVSEDAHFRTLAAKGEAVARPELGHSVHVEVSGLNAQRPYWYRFSLGNTFRSAVGRVRTAAPAGADLGSFTIAVAGCQAFAQGWYTAWRHLSREDGVDAIFHYGDYIYENGEYSSFQVFDGSGKPVLRRHVGNETYSLDDYRRRYAQYKTDPDLQAAHQSAAFISSFDDHEIDNNWADVYDQDGTPPEVFALRRLAALQAWYEHSPVRKQQFPTASGLKMFRRLNYGNLVRLHVLDTRSYRSDQMCRTPDELHCRSASAPDETMLGAAQERWLAEGLDGTPTWHLLAQQVRVMPLQRVTADRQILSEPEDTWGGYPASRQRLSDMINEARLTNVVIASGDAHMHNVGTVPRYSEDPSGPSVATEFLASSISSGGDGAPVTPTIQAYLDGENPNLKLANHQRGYQLLNFSRGSMVADIRVLDQVQAPGGRQSSLARFAVTPDMPRIQLR